MKTKLWFSRTGLAILLIPPGILLAQEPPLPTLTASSAVVVDRDTGLVLGVKSPDTRRAMAGTTKIMTALLAIERNRTSLTARVTVSATAARAGGASMGLAEGDQLSLRDLLHGMMLESGNDAAVAIAEHVAGSEAAFVTLMNNRAAQLVLANTQFRNAHGRDPVDIPWQCVAPFNTQPNCGHYSSARDLAMLARFALKEPVFACLVDTTNHLTTTWISAQREAKNKVLTNSNPLLASPRYPGAHGVKDGISGNAGQCLVASAGVPGKQVITALLHSNDPNAEGRLLLDFGFELLSERLHPTSLASGFFNNDSYEDLAVGIPYAEVAGVPAAGQVVIFYGTTNGLDTNSPICFSQESTNISTMAEWGDYFAFALAVGDFDRNGRDDLAIGAPFENSGQGAVFVIYSDASGLNPAFRAQVFVQQTAEAGDLFGFSLATGDFDNNGADDLAIGVPGEDTETVVAVDGGAVNVLYGSASGLDATLHPQRFDQSDPTEVPGNCEDGDQFGYALAAGDFDGNGYADLAIGAPFERLGGTTTTNAGHVSIIYGHTGGLDAQWKTGQFSQPVGTGLSAAETGDLFGYALAAGDFDNNGRLDVAIGAPGETVGSRSKAGLVDVVYSDETGLNAAFRVQEFYQDTANIPDTSEAGDRFGAALAVGDFDNSRPNYTRDDLAIGVPGEDLEGPPALTNVGAVLVLYANGANGLLAGTDTDWLVPQSALGVTQDAGPGEQFGAVLAAGRFDSGNTEDLAWGGYGERYDGWRMQSGATLATYSRGLSGLRNGTEQPFDPWLTGCCDYPISTLHVFITNGVGKVWNVRRGNDLLWRYEGRDYEDAAISDRDNPTNTFARDLNRTLSTAHFRIYYADHGQGAVGADVVAEKASWLEEGWNALIRHQGFRDPVELQAEGRYTLFRDFRRIPVLIYSAPDIAGGGASKYPFIRLSPEVGAGTPIHEFFHLIYHGYVLENPGWLHEGLARWAQQFRPGGTFPCNDNAYMPLHHNFLTRDYCYTAPWFQYLGIKYTHDGDGSDVIRALLEEIADATDDFGRMHAFERALDRFDPQRYAPDEAAFPEWTAGNYVDDTLTPPTMRANAPLYPRYKEGGRIAPGGNRYLFREYAFTLPRTDTVTIQVRASAGDLDKNDDDDDLRFLLDGVVLGDWDSTNALDGETLQGKLRTIHLVQRNVAAGPHTLRLEADEHPILYSLTVFEGDVPLLIQSSAEARPATFLNAAPFLTNTFTTNVTNLTIYITGIASNYVQNKAAGYTNDGDNIRLRFDGAFVTVWGANEDLYGDALEGDLATVEIRLPSASRSSHTLVTYADGRPLIQEIVAFPTPEQPPLLQVRTIRLVPWSADYRVVPVTQPLIDSGDALRIDFEAMDWNPGNPPFTQGMSLNASNTLVGASTRQHALSRSWNYLAPIFPAFLGVDGRLVHITTATSSSGTAEWVVTRIPDANNAPALASMGVRNAREGQELRFTVSASDPDVPANRLTYTLGLNAPAGARIDGRTGEFTWTPSETQGPGGYDITVHVTDDGDPSLSDSETFRVTVAEVNQAPQMNRLINHDVQEGEAVSFGVMASDPDRPMNALTYSLDPGAPAGMSIDADSGWLTWIPQEVHGPGTYSVTVRVTDNGVPPLSYTRSFNVVVHEVNVAPVLANIPDRTIYVGEDVRIAPSATDFDMPANTLSWQLTAGPADATMDPQTGVFRWVPAISGEQMFTLQVSDNDSPSLSDSENFLVTAIEGPQITAISIDGNRVRVTFTTLPGRVYRLQSTADLGNPDWTDATEDVPAAADETTVEVVKRATSQQFYRVIVIR